MQRGPVRDSVWSVPGRDSDISQLLTAEGFGGLCHQEGGLLNSASAWEEIVGFLVTGGFAWSDPLHLFISAARFLSVVCQFFVAVCVLF